MINPVRISTLHVVKKSREVKINRERIKEIAKKWAKTGLKVPRWPRQYHLITKDKQRMLDYLVVLDSLNFCYWANGPKRWQIEYNGKKYNGYFGWSLTLKKFFEENPKKANLEYFSKISFRDFKKILQGGKNLLFLKKRWQILKAVSQTILKKYGSSLKFIESAGRKLSVLTPKIVKELPFFNDVSRYQGKKVYFLKRAQILGSEIWGAFSGKGIGYFKDLDYLTCFPDYKIPQALNNFGILEYSKSLERKIKNRDTIPVGSSREVEIRACTVWAVEYLKEELGRLGRKISAVEVDWILWNKTKEMQMKKPYHLTKTIFY